MDRALTQEVADRCRRMETRITKIANHLGVEAGGDKPIFDNGDVFVPSRFCSLRDLIDAVPSTYRGRALTVRVYLDDELLMTISVP